MFRNGRGKVGGHFTTKPSIAQDRVHRRMGRCGGQIIIGPMDKIPGGAGAGIECIGILDKIRVFGRLRERFHDGRFAGTSGLCKGGVAR